MLENVKNALSIDYADRKIDRMLELKIAGAVEYLAGAGVVITEKSRNSSLYKNAIITFVLDNWQLEHGKTVMSPAFLSYCVQLRNTKEEAYDEY